MAKLIGKSRARYWVALAALLIAAVFCGCTEGDGMDKRASNQTLLIEGVSDPAETGAEKRYFRISVYLVRDRSLSLKDYTPEDFPEINCTQVFELMPLTFETARQQAEAERTGYWGNVKGMLLDLSNYQRGLELIVYESKESLYRAVNLLENRNDISAVYYDEWVKPDFKPTRGEFADLGLDVETENQILLDRFYLYSPEGSIDRLTGSADIYFIERYYGTYHGYVVIAFPIDALGCVQITVADKVFDYFLLAWKQGEKPGGGRFYDVREAYDLGLLTTDDVENMYDMQMKYELN